MNIEIKELDGTYDEKSIELYKEFSVLNFPQTLTLETSDTLTLDPLANLSDEEMIGRLKMKGYKITKEY